MKELTEKELMERENLSKGINRTIAQLETENPEVEKVLEKLRFKQEAEEWADIQKFNDSVGNEAFHTVISSKDLLAREYPPQSWLIDKILPIDGITLIVGEAGTLKSYLSLYIAKCLTTQEKFLGNFEVNRKAKILLIDKENKLRRIKKRMVGLGFPEDTEDIYLLEYPEKFNFEDKEFMNFVINFIEKTKIDLVIIDSFIDMFQGNENSSTDTALAFNYIRNLSPTASFIVLHHDSKPMPKMVRSAAQKTRGSSNIIAQVDTQFYLEKGKDMKSVIVEQGKSRDDEPIAKFTIGIVTDPEIGITNFSYLGEFKTEITKIEESKTLIYDFIQSHSFCTKDDIVEYLLTFDIGPATTKIGLEYSMKNGLVDFIQKPGYGRKHFYFVVEEKPENEEK